MKKQAKHQTALVIPALGRQRQEFKVSLGCRKTVSKQRRENGWQRWKSRRAGLRQRTPEEQDWVSTCLLLTFTQVAVSAMQTTSARARLRLMKFLLLSSWKYNRPNVKIYCWSSDLEIYIYIIMGNIHNTFTKKPTQSNFKLGKLLITLLKINVFILCQCGLWSLAIWVWYSRTFSFF